MAPKQHWGGNQGRCKWFDTPQGCRYGDACKFFHEGGARGGATPSYTNGRNANDRRTGKQKKTPPTPDEQEFFAWRRSVPRDGLLGTRLGSRQLTDFFQKAEELVTKDANVRQSVIKELASDGGLTRVNELATQDLSGLSEQKKVDTLEKLILPLLKIMSHPHVITSPVLEQQVATLHNYLYGVSGKRLCPILELIVSVYPHLLAVEADNPTAIRVMDATSLVLVTLLEINSQTAVDEVLHHNIKVLAAACPQLTAEDSSALWTSSRKNFALIQRRVDLGLTLPTQLPARRSAPSVHATFHVQRRPPGGRHDNDHADICDIRILPTFGEVSSVEDEYLPTTDPAEHHVQGVDGLLDRHFRLLREDTVGQLRNAVSAELYRMQGREESSRSKRARQNAARTFVYNGVHVEYVYTDDRQELCVEIGFAAPQHMQWATRKQQRDYLERTRRLQKDALVCLLSGKGAAVFCSIVDAPEQRRDNSTTEVSAPPGRMNVYVKLASEDASDVNLLLDYFAGPATRTALVEFPGVLLPAFEHTLKALQHMKKQADLPFAELLLPPPADLNGHEITPKPPSYSARPGFRYNLKCLTSDDSDLWLSPDAEFGVDELCSKSTLDHKQAVGLVHALTRSLALIQGPPGTGKSYVGEMLIKVLLANNTKRPTGTEGADLGPILCVTYTNHALDQQLEHLLAQGVTQIIRMGSRSKSEALKDVTLFEVSRKVESTREERSSRWSAKEEVKACEEALVDSLQDSWTPPSEARIRDFLQERFPRHHELIFGQDKDGWRTQTGRKDKIKHWCQRGSESTTDRSLTALILDDPENLSKSERFRLLNHWKARIRERAAAELQDALKALRAARKTLDCINTESKLRCLQQANVVGCTTSGLARNLDLLRRCRFRVMLCEEAGEVLEAHLLTTFLPSIEHAILIGDHLQLRPQTQNYNLKQESHQGAQYALDVSLFERLVLPNVGIPSIRIPFTTLETQRRMHPTISSLVRDYLYPALQDHPSVSDYPEVAGMKRRLFWLHHTNFEDGVEDVSAVSFANSFEVEMTASLVAHLVRQGTYKPEDIAVLTPYLGQLRKLRQRLSSSFEIAVSDRDEDDLEKHGLQDLSARPSTVAADQAKIAVGVVKTTLLQALRVATVDNFQGEEAKVIVVSLVRSNGEQKCGFLKTSNRINVLLSRARHGMYIIGNADTSAHVGMWANTIRLLQEGNNFGTHLELQCSRHKELPISVARPDDFVVFSPEGGCNQKCVDGLPCGHACPKSCHAVHLHNAVYCLKECPRSLPGCDHVCQLPCGDKCKPCKVEITLSPEERVLRCGHTIDTLPCRQYQKLASFVCMAKVSQTVPKCGHTVSVRCGTDVSAPTFQCAAECGAPLPCGHTCRRHCHQCRRNETADTTGIDHGRCQQTCGRSLNTCAHYCKSSCHGAEPCPLCPQPCQVRCSHSKCNKRCSEPCTPCAEERCSSSCPHSQCTMPCAAPCNWLPCSKRCEKKLGCGHQCPSVCGEQCPSEKFCQTCADGTIKGTQVDYIEFTPYGDVDLGSEPCIFPSCGHFLTVSSMDGQMDFAKYYSIDEQGCCSAIASVAEPFSMDEVKSCPQCRGSLRNIARYGMIVRRAQLDLATKRFINSTNKQYVKLAEDFSSEQDRLSASHDDFDTQLIDSDDCVMTGSRDEYFLTLPRALRTARYKAISELRWKIGAFATSTQAHEQPFGRVWQAAQNARRRHGAQPSFAYDATVIQTKASLLALSLALQCDLTILADFLGLRQRAPPAPLAATLELNFDAAMRDCHGLAARAGAASARLQQAQAHVFAAHFAALERVHAAPERGEALRQSAAEQLEAARGLRRAHPNATAAVQADIDAVEGMLANMTFYAPVTAAEMRAVWEAMGREFSGTGHWYTCQNGHYFTIGECGMAMQEARCPECGAAIGGRNHQAAAGVEHARDLEMEMARLAVE